MLLGLLLALSSTIVQSHPFGAGDAVALAGLAVVVMCSACNFKTFLPLSPVLPRRAGRLRAEEDLLEDANDAQWELAEQALRYCQLLDAQQDFLVRRTADGRIVFANSAFCDAFGVRREDVLGSLFRPVVITADRPSLASAPGKHAVELLRTRKGERWIAWDRREVRSERGETEYQSAGRDITVERAIEHELKKARDLAEAGSRAKSRFLAAMSHEIRTPMGGILGMVGLLRDTSLDEEQKTYAEAVEISARALVILIDDILDFSKIEAGKLDIACEVFSVKACIAQAMQLLGPEAGAKHLSLTERVDAGVPDYVRGDAMRVRQIVLNLLSNAVKFTDAGGIEVHVFPAEIEAAGGGIVRIAIEVTDTGIGFHEAATRRLFGEFEQGDDAAAREGRGSGLGLAISRRLARAMGGDIVVKSAPSKGATFTALLRLEVADAPSAPAELGWPAGPARAGTIGASSNGEFNVLIAEDNRISALLAAKVVERAGGTAVVVEDGRGAIAAVREAMESRRPHFDLILMDVVMPGVDGLIASKSIKALYAEREQPGAVTPPIIALTAGAFPQDRDRCRAADMDDYLAKPFDVQHLQDVLLRWAPPRMVKSSPAA